MNQKLYTALLFIIVFIGGAKSYSQSFNAVTSTTLVGINSSGSVSPLTVGIGVTAPTAQFHTTGSVRFAGITNDNS